MAIEWDVSGIQDYESKFPPLKVGEKKEWNRVTDSITWLAFFCGFSEITEGNLKKIAARVISFEKILGPVFPNCPVTYNELKDHVGLKIWGRHLKVKTDAGFCSYLGRRVYEDAKILIEKEPN